jgi:protein-S-isoprenylcysteine O-methyltransferase Ste14
MSLNDILRWLPLVTLAVMLLAAKVRAFVMQRRGLRVMVVDWDRPLNELIYDTLLIVVALCWIFLLVAEAWPLSLAWLPDWLTTQIVARLPAKVIGAVLVLIAPALFAAALRSLGESWRMGIDSEQPGPLVTSGLFAWSRNPIYLAFDLLIIGAFLIHDRVIFLLLGAALVLFVHGIVLREERFLASRFGEEFRAYYRRVGRYLPWV